MRAMRALSSYDFPAIAANLTAHAMRRSADTIVHYGWHVPRRAVQHLRTVLQMAGVATYSLFTLLMLLSGCLAVLFAATARAFLPKRFEHLDERLSTLLDDVLDDKAE